MMLLWKKRATSSALSVYSKWKMLLTMVLEDALNVWTQAIKQSKQCRNMRTEPGIFESYVPSSCTAKRILRRYKSELLLFRRWFRNRMRSDGNPWKAGPLWVKFNISTMNSSTVAEQGFAGCYQRNYGMHGTCGITNSADRTTWVARDLGG
jgi:hypothetical protein